jgi:drug/metabolite transporter (DMT)-like permease
VTQPVNSPPLRRRALIWLLFSSVCFGAMAFAAKEAARELSGSQIAVVRFAVMLLPILLWPRWWRAAVTWTRKDLLLYRGIFGGVAVLLYFLTIEKIPVGIATLLNYTSPLWSVAFAALFLAERVRWALVPPALAAFAGVVLVVLGRPADAPTLVGNPWVLVGAISAVLSGAAVTAIRAARRTEGSWAIFASFSLFGLLAALPLAWGSWRNPSAEAWFWLILVGLTSVGAQLSMTHAYKWATNLEAGALAQLAVVITLVLGAWLLDEPLTPVAIVGAILAVGGVLAVVWLQRTPRAVE